MSYKVIRDSLGDLVCFGPNDEHYDPGVPAGCVMTIEENAPSQSIQQQRDAIQVQIDMLERESLMNRMLREFAISQMEAAAISFGAAQVPTLTADESLAYAYATNIAYKKTKDLDTQITNLRTQKDAIV